MQSGARGADRAVLIVIVHAGDWRDPSQHATISTYEIADRAGLSRATVIDAIARLTAGGVLVSTKHPHSTSDRLILWSRLADYATPAAKGSHGERSARGLTTPDPRSLRVDRQPVTQDEVDRAEVDRQPVQGRPPAGQGVTDTRSGVDRQPVQGVTASRSVSSQPPCVLPGSSLDPHRAWWRCPRMRRRPAR